MGTERGKTGKLTLIDGCVLIVLIGAAAFVLTPAVSGAKEEKKLSDMVGRLQIIRSQISLFRAEHNGLLPGQHTAVSAVRPEDFAAAMKQSCLDGTGSYLSAIPQNPYVPDPDAAAAMTCVNDPDAKPTGQEGTGWWFNAATGDFYACDSAFHTNY
jgi:general secretion pathway protein G